MSVVSGIMGAGASKKAAQTQANAARYSADMILQGMRESNALTKTMYDTGRADQAPWRETGANALKTLYEKVQAGPGEFTASPEYQFRFGEGQRAVESSAAARGNVLGGRTLKELTRYGQGFGSNEYQNFLANYYQSLAPYQALSTQGQAAAAGTAASGLSAANTISNTTTQGTGNAGQAYMAGGNAQAAGYINQANALGNIAPNALNSYMAWKSYTPNQPANYAPAVGSPAYNQLGAAYDNYYGYST